LHGNADAAARQRIAALEIAHEIALADDEASALHAIGDRDAAARAIDGIAGDHRAFELILGQDRGCLDRAERVAAYMEIRGLDRPQGGGSAIANPVVGNDDLARANDGDAVAARIAGAA